MLLCKKIARASGGHKKFMLNKLEGVGLNKIDPIQFHSINKRNCVLSCLGSVSAGVEDIKKVKKFFILILICPLAAQYFSRLKQWGGQGDRRGVHNLFSPLVYYRRLF